MAIVDKLKELVNSQKRIIIFLLIITLVGVATGSIFNVLLNSTDKTQVKDYIENFFFNIQNNSLDYMSSLKNSLTGNLVYIFITWILGISIIGLPITLFMYFINAVVLGFSITRIISVYGAKGILYSFAYVFPHQILAILANTFLMIYVLSISIYLIKMVFTKQSVNFKNIINKYLIVLGISMGLGIINSLLEVFLMPTLIKLVVSAI
jgi:stage II sporulation protein M